MEPFQPGCPWWDMRASWGAPNVKWCEPGNHWLQGHAAWHGLSALALLFATRHYARSMQEVAR